MAPTLASPVSYQGVRRTRRRRDTAPIGPDLPLVRAGAAAATTVLGRMENHVVGFDRSPTLRLARGFDTTAYECDCDFDAHLCASAGHAEGSDRPDARPLIAQTQRGDPTACRTAQQGQRGAATRKLRSRLETLSRFHSKTVHRDVFCLGVRWQWRHLTTASKP